MNADVTPMSADKEWKLGPTFAVRTLGDFICVHRRTIGVHRRFQRFLLPPAAVLLFTLAGCAVGPNYSKPEVEVPPQWKEAGDWVVAKPKDDAPKGKWWEAFGDPVLNGLVEQGEVSNPTLAAAEARYRQARAAVTAARASLFPTLGANANASRARGTGNRHTVSLDANWEVDLWGRIRRLLEAARAGEQASAADLEAARLSLQAELATDYFQLRVTDTQIDLLDETVKAFEASYKVTQNRYRSGVAAKVDVVQAEQQLLSTQASAIDLRATRAALEHALPVLTGKPPASFALEPAKFRAHLPEVPPGLPSTVLERRPDVAGAERRMAAANARIGAAQSAYFPALSLTGSAGFASNAVSTLFSAPSRFWSIGAGLADTLLDFGTRAAAVETSRAQYDETVANYRETVLGAFQEVEDQLAAVHWLSEEGELQQESARAARGSVVLTVNQYKAGPVGSPNVVQVQAT